MKRLLILTAILTLMVGAANSQVLKPVKWQISFKKVSEGGIDDYKPTEANRHTKVCLYY